MSDSTSTISPTSPVKIVATDVVTSIKSAEAAVSNDISALRTKIEKDIAAARKAVDTTVSTDVAKVESLFSKVKPYLVYAGLLVLGVLIGHFIK